MKKYTKKDRQILTLISNFCQNECGECQSCPEEECVLFNIERVVTGEGEKKDDK